MKISSVNCRDLSTNLEELSAATEQKNNQTKEHAGCIDEKMRHQGHTVNKIDVDIDMIEHNLKMVRNTSMLYLSTLLIKTKLLRVIGKT